MLTFSHLL